MVRTTVFKQFCKEKDKLQDRIGKLEESLKKDENNVEKLKELAIIFHYVKEDDKAIAIYEKLHQPETAFFSVVQDDVYGYIWIFGYHELYAFKVADGHLEKVDLSSYMFDYNKMFSQIIKDREGNLWAGAYDSGYHLLMGNPAITNNFLPKLKKHVGFDTNITTLGIDPNNGLWFNIRNVLLRER